jgi:hypothetical protein
MLDMWMARVYEGSPGSESTAPAYGETFGSRTPPVDADGNQSSVSPVRTRQSGSTRHTQTGWGHRTGQTDRTLSTAGQNWTGVEPSHAFDHDTSVCDRPLSAAGVDTSPADGSRGMRWSLTRLSESAGPTGPYASSFGLVRDRPGAGGTRLLADSTGGGDGEYLSRRQYLALAMGATGAGATAGGAASGVLEGSSTTDVDQAVILRELETYASGGGLSLIDDSNTAFEVGVTVAQGEQYVLHLLVDNRADEQTTQQLSFDDVPHPLSVEVFGDPPTGVAAQQVEPTEWLVNIEPEHPSNSTSVPDDEQIIEVLVSVANTASPGTYELSGTLEPTSP